MQNGCTLQSDLVEQIFGLTQKKQFNQILIESSGVSEPHEIPSLFDSMSMTMPTKLLNVKQPHEQVWLGETGHLSHSHQTT